MSRFDVEFDHFVQGESFTICFSPVEPPNLSIPEAMRNTLIKSIYNKGNSQKNRQFRFICAVTTNKNTYLLSYRFYY